MNVFVTWTPFTASESGADANRGEYVFMLLFRLVICAQKINYDCNMYKTTPYVCHLIAHDTGMDEKDRIRTVQDTFYDIPMEITLQRSTSRLLGPLICLSLTIRFVRSAGYVVCRCIVLSRCYTKGKNRWVG